MNQHKNKRSEDDPAKLEPLSSLKKYIKKRGYKPAKKDLINLGDEYQERNFPIVQQRIYQAGMRLGELLNQIFSSQNIK
jgi:hypothetical protein